jgi:hypothetical protein
MAKLTKEEKKELKDYKLIRGTFKRIAELTGFYQEYVGDALGINKSNVGYFHDKGMKVDLNPHTGAVYLVRPEEITKRGKLADKFTIEGVK